jgi:hypothetical protein
MDKTFKCPNGHKFKSNFEKPACPQCSETASPVQWKKVEDEPARHRKGSDRKILKTALNITTAGLFGGLAGSGSSGNSTPDDFSGKGGDFGGGGAGGSF